ncbi:hypothetical protein NC661_13580 [Aquibacillus koreensis]|uniref:Uncharacterized protein n=1 Tax=Aquibacillus koreensis TaxID=279446 RepID=A0A9X4AIQ8_9BACI|nr:hypothetical protein [Aquibacillus koreensis]MCT2536245.1 hypothetical protein [Aquibacillus koreensis]MDC3421402.1 hypothetical protein [Aquibacillus koreensis]
MQSNKKFKKRYLITFSLLLLLLLGMYFGPSVLGGYALTEHSAIRFTFPNQDGEVVSEKEIEDRNIVVWDTGKVNYVKLIESPLGIFKRVTNVSSISGETIDEKMKVTWSGAEIEDEFYDVIFAAELLDKEIEKVIVSNEQDDKKNTPLSIVEEQSTVFIEMDIKDGFAVHYSKLPNGDVGSFSFRGIDSDGKIISFD